MPFCHGMLPIVAVPAPRSRCRPDISSSRCRRRAGRSSGSPVSPAPWGGGPGAAAGRRESPGYRARPRRRGRPSPFPGFSGIEEAPAEGRIIGVNGAGELSIPRGGGVCRGRGPFRLAIKPLDGVSSGLMFSPWLFATWSRHGRTGGWRLANNHLFFCQEWRNASGLIPRPNPSIPRKAGMDGLGAGFVYWEETAKRACATK